MTPGVSVIMAAYNGAQLITPTLEALSAQSFTDWEAVVVDDCSTDDTVAVLRAYPDPRVRVIVAEHNGGPVRARNLAMTHARGRYIAALDHDDLCRPERFARQVGYLERHPEVVLVGTAASMLRGEEVNVSDYAPVTTPLLIEWLMRIENPLVWSSVMFRAGAAHSLEPFSRTQMLYAEDFDLYHRLSRFGRIARLDEDLLLYRQHVGGLSKRFAEKMHASAAAVLREVYAPLLGDDAPSAAALVVRHVMGGQPAPDRATLGRLGGIITTLQQDFLGRQAVSRDDRRLIRWETARRWARIGRASLRTGAIGLGDALAVRPDHLGLGYAPPEGLVWSRVVGGVRQVKRLYTGE